MSGLPPFADELALLVRAAEDSGEIARRFWRQSPQVWDKGGAEGPVSEADLAVNAHLQATLIGARPGYGWLSEESPDDASRLDARRCFIVDPIDGTRAFIEGQQGFSHSLALAEGDRIVAAVVHLPIARTTYAASADGPALRDGRPILASASPLEGARVLTAKVNLQPHFWRGGTPPPVRREFRSSIAWRLCLVADGSFDAVLSLRAAWEWDVAAGALIAAQAGATVTDRHGVPMRFNSPGAQTDGLIVAGPAIHNGLMDRLAPESAA